jgi:S-adenosylmethionine:tRNA ribosyltransferase-isomerase
MNTAELEYELPRELIAQHPAERRDASRLLVYERASGAVRHGRFGDLPDELEQDTLVVVNDTRVVPARLRLRRRSGGAVEVLLLERLHEGVRATLVVPGAIANREGDGSAHKLDPARVAEVVVRVATLPADCVVREVAVDPATPLRPPYAGIERLQYA